MKDYGINLINLNYGVNPQEPRKLVCPVCGVEFETTNSTRKYCSAECAKIAHKRQKKRWIDEHYEQHKIRCRENARRWRRENKERRKAYASQYYQSRKEEAKAYGRKYYWDHLEDKRAYARLYSRTRNGIVARCRAEHNDCFDCPMENGECLYE